MNDTPADPSKRTWVIASACTGAIGGVATAVPFVRSITPSERAKAAGASVEVDIATLQPGEKLVVEWRGKPVWIIRRTPAQLQSLEGIEAELADPQSRRTAYAATPGYARNPARAIRPEYFVTVGICPHLGCSPTDRFAAGPQPSLPSNWQGGFLCPCHGSTFDMAGRVFRNKPSPDNLEIPPHRYLSDTRILIGEDQA